jgi:hypothetical protein
VSEKKWPFFCIFKYAVTLSNEATTIRVKYFRNFIGKFDQNRNIFFFFLELTFFQYTAPKVGMSQNTLISNFVNSTVYSHQSGFFAISHPHL